MPISEGMAMAVAEKTMTEKVVRNPHTQLAIGSLLGAVYLLASVWVILAGLPQLWGQVLQVHTYVNEFLSSALLLISTILLGLALGYVGFALERTHYRKGLRSGAVIGAVAIAIILWSTLGIGARLERAELGPVAGFITVAIGVGLLSGLFKLYFSKGFTTWMESLEDSGWFQGTPYKANQGVRVRRGTVLAILTLGICGIYTLVSHHSLGSDLLGPNDWYWTIPHVSRTGMITYIPILFRAHLTVPIIMGLFTLWFAWRVVNWPTFADFLIATEAEMNKVSWSSRKRLVQDTIVVLVTVFLLTTFLFLIDILWIKFLSAPYIRVLQIDPQEEQRKQQDKTQW